MSATPPSTTPRWTIPFFTIWIGQAFSLFGSSLVSFALVWWLTEKTGSATVLATSTLVAMLPQVLLGPFAGTLVDRWNRRRIMIGADGLIALATLALIVIFASGAERVWHIYVILFIRSVGSGFHGTAWQASIALMVPEQHLARIAGMNQTLNGIMNIVSPPLGALLLGLMPMQGVLAVDVVTASIAITAVLLIHIPQPQRTLAPTADAAAPSMLDDLRAGLRYVANWRGLQIVLVMAALINFLFTPAFSLLPLMVTDHFHGGKFELGWINSAWGVGVVVGGLLLSTWGGFKRKLLTSMTGLVGMGIGTAMIGLTPGSAFAVAVAAMFFAGLMNPITNGPLSATLQSTVAPEMQGRVFTLTGSFATGMSLISLMVAGPLADLLGVRTWYVVGGIVCTLLGASGFFIPALAEMENHKARLEALAVTVEPAGESLPDVPARGGASLAIDTSLDR